MGLYVEERRNETASDAQPLQPPGPASVVQSLHNLFHPSIPRCSGSQPSFWAYKLSSSSQASSPPWATSSSSTRAPAVRYFSPTPPSPPALAPGHVSSLATPSLAPPSISFYSLTSHNKIPILDNINRIRTFGCRILPRNVWILPHTFSFLQFSLAVSLPSPF